MHLPDIYYKYNHIRKMKWSSIQSFSDSQYLGFLTPHPHHYKGCCYLKETVMVLWVHVFFDSVKGDRQVSIL